MSNFISRAIDYVEDKTTDFLHNITGIPTADEKRNIQRQVADQIKAYKDQTAITEQQINETRAEKAVEKRRINEKQIRSLRNNYRPAGGFLNNQGQAQSSPGIGGSGPLPNKLGTT